MNRILALQSFDGSLSEDDPPVVTSSMSVTCPPETGQCSTVSYYCDPSVADETW